MSTPLAPPKPFLQKNIKTVRVLSPSYQKDLATILAYLNSNGVIRA
jgi:hypothetical protein